MGTIAFDRLAVFAAVAEHRGFSAAALQLGRPKSSVSRTVAALEDELGVRLLHRTTRRVALSTAGAALYDRIAPQLVALKQATEELPERDLEPSGQLRVTTLNDLGLAFVVELATRFVARYPRVDIDLVLTGRLVDLVAERIDVALRATTRPMRDSSLMARRVGRTHMQLFAAPTYLSRRGTPKHPRELATHDWVSITSAAMLRLEGPGGTFALPTHAHIRCNEGTALKTAICAGGGIGALPSFLVQDELERNLLKRVLPRWSLPRADLWFVCPSARQLPRKVSAFRAFVTEALKSQPQLAL